MPYTEEKRTREAGTEFASRRRPAPFWRLPAGQANFMGAPSDFYIAPTYPSQKVRLFDLEADPKEAVDVAGEHPHVTRRLKARYDEWVRENTGRY